MPTVTNVISGLESQARSIITDEIKTNPKLSESEAVKAVENGADALLAHAGPLGALAESLVNMYIELDVPLVYQQVVNDALGTQAGTAAVAAQAG